MIDGVAIKGSLEITAEESCACTITIITSAQSLFPPFLNTELYHMLASQHKSASTLPEVTSSSKCMKPKKNCFRNGLVRIPPSDVTALSSKPATCGSLLCGTAPPFHGVGYDRR